MGLGNAWLGAGDFPPPTTITPDFLDDSVVYEPNLILGTIVTPDFLDDSAVYEPDLILGTIITPDIVEDWEVYEPTVLALTTTITPDFLDDSIVYEPNVGLPVFSFLVRRGPLVKDWGDWTPATAQDVHVYVDSVEVDVADVNPYHGEIFLAAPIVPSPTVEVKVDYKWIRDPIMGMLLNTKGLALNKSDRRKGDGQYYGPGGTITGHGDQIQAPGFPKGALRTHSRFMFRTVLQGPPTPYLRPTPLLIGHRYIGFEKAYSAVLNSPTTLRLNNPPGRVAKLGSKRSVEGVSEWFEGTETPETSTPPWALEGYDAGQVNLNQGTYTVVDSRSGSFDPEDPDVTLYWRSVDLTYPASSYIVGRFQIEDANSLLDPDNTNILATDGVFTGVGFGIHNNLRFWLAGALLVNGLEHVGLLLDSRRPEKVDSWRVGPYSTATILSTTSMSVLTGQAPLDLSDGHRFQILTGTQTGVYTADHVVHQSDGTTTVTVSPAFPADFTRYGNQYPEVVWESLWSENPSTYRLEVAPERNLAVLKVSGATTGTVAYMNDTAPLLAEGDLIGQTAVSNLLAGITLGTGAGRVEYLAVPLGQAGNGITVSHVDPGVGQETTTVDVVGTDITVTLAREADTPAEKATLTLGTGSSSLHLQSSVAGTGGNLIQVALVDPAAPSSPLSVSVLGSAITVNLETDVGSTIISTAGDVAAAINADVLAQVLVDAVGSIGVVAAAPLTFLTGGVNLIPGALTATAADVVEAVGATPAATALVDAYGPVAGLAQVDSRMLSGGRGITTEGSGQVFWGSLSAKATSRSKWSFFRYGIVPDYGTLRSSSQTVAAEMAIRPDSETYNPWFVTQQFGYSVATGSLLLKSTSNHSTLNLSYGYDRVEPFMLPHAFLDVQANLQVDSGVVGSGDAQIVIRDTQREVRVSNLLYEEGFSGINWRRLVNLASVSYAGLLSPEKLGWTSSAASTTTEENVGPVLNIVQGSEEFGTYEKEIDPLVTYSLANGRIFEARLAVLTYTEDPAGQTTIRFGGTLNGRFIEVRLWAGATPSVRLLDTTGAIVQSYPFDWTDGLPHTYRVVADAVGNTVVLSIDDLIQAPTKTLVAFATGAGDPDCTFGIGLATGINAADVTSETEWYSVSAQALPAAAAKRTLGVWKGGDPDDINSWEIPRTDSSTAPNSWQVGPAVEEMDWRSPIELRVFKSPQWGVTVYRPDMALPPYYVPETPGVPGTGFATQTTEPSAGWINVETADLPRVASIFGSVAFGALDPMALTQQRWDWMRYRLYRPASASHLAPQGMVLNRANVVTSGEIYKDIVLETVVVKVADSTSVSLFPAHQRAEDVYKIMDGATSYVRDSWTFDKSSQTVTLNEGLTFTEPTVTVTFVPGHPVTSTYLQNQPVLDGVTQLNEGTPPVPKGQTVAASRAEQVRDYPALIPDRITSSAYSPNDPAGIPDSAAYQAADTNTFAEFMTATAVQYEKMSFIEVLDGGETGLIATVSDTQDPDYHGPKFEVEGWVFPLMDFSEVFEPLVAIQGPIAGAVEGDSEVSGFLSTIIDISGSVEGDSNVSGFLSAPGPLAGAIEGDSEVSGTMEAFGALLGSVEGDSEVAGTMGGPGALAGAVEGNSEVTGTMSSVGLLAGAVQGDSAVSGTMGGTGALAGLAEGDSSVTGSMVAPGSLAGSVEGDSSVSGTLGGSGALAGLVEGDSNVTGTMAGPGEMSGVIEGNSGVSGTLIGDGALLGAAEGDSQTTAFLSGLVDISGSVSGDSNVTGTISGPSSIVGAAQGDSNVTGALVGEGALAGAASGDSDVSGALGGVGTLAGAVEGDSQTAGTVGGVGALLGAASGDSTLAGTIEDAPPAAFVDMRFSTPGSNTFSTAWVPAKANGITKLAQTLLFTNGGASNRIQYTGAPTRIFLVNVAVYLTRDNTLTPPDRSGVYLYKGGSALSPPVLIETRLGSTAADPGEASLTATVSLAQNEYLEIWIASNADDSILRLQAGQMTAIAITP